MGHFLDDLLAYPNRTLRAYPGKLLMGPTGDRLFADCLDKKPGFCGNIDFIHKVNIDMLFETVCSLQPDYTTAETIWYPSQLKLSYEDRLVSLSEVKMIVSNDIAFCVQHWTNKGEQPLTISLRVRPDKCTVEQLGSRFYFETPEPRHDYRVSAAVGWNQEGNDVEVSAGGSVCILAAAAVGNAETESREDVCARLERFFENGLKPDEYAAQAEKEYTGFFDTLPRFQSSDPLLDKTWWYRWYILRNATAKPDFGYLKHTTVYEGRAHKTKKTEALKVDGWEFSRLISLSGPLHMTDYRWCPDKEMLHDIVKGYFDTMDEDGICRSAFVNHRGGPFANFMVWAVYRMFLVDGDVEFVREMLPQLKKCVDGNIKVYGSDNDLLQIEVKHQRTGKEFQPSYWYFSDFPENGKDKSKITPLKRMDTSVYLYLNIQGLARMMSAAGDSQAEEYFEKARTLADQINEKTWDAQTAFYYDLNAQTDEKAMVKNIVGIYPYWAEIAPGDEQHLEGLEKLFDPQYFNTGAVFSTVAKDCVAYAPHGGWMGIMRGRDSCVWDGPSWPYTNGIALEAVGRQSKLHGHRYDRQFAEFLHKYSLEHYRHHDFTKPYLVEQYHAETDEDLSDEPDYNHSYYLDLIVEFVAGVDVQQDQVVIDPLDIGLRSFCLDHLIIRGKCFAVELTEEGVFSVKVDKNTVFEGKGLQRVVVPL